MKALILDKKVVDLSEKEFDVSPSFTWVDCDNTVEVGYTYDKSKFNAPSEPTVTDEDLAFFARRRRNMLLQQSDWTQSRDVTLSNDADWKTYRKALRDISSQSGFPKKITWPTAP